MANTYYASIFAKFYNPHIRDTWIKEHGVDESIPNGGPVTSYSTKYEGIYRDILMECEDYFDNLADADMDQDGYIPNKEMTLLIKIRDALAK